MRVEGLKMLSAKPDSANIFQLRAPTRMFACDCSTMLHRLHEVWASVRNLVPEELDLVPD